MVPEAITSEVKFDPRRRFQVWSYRVGHSQLLVRSNPEDGLETRIELLFKSVASVLLPTVMLGLTVRVASNDEELPPWADAHEGRKVYSVGFSGGDGFIVAGAAFVSEDALDYSAPSAFAESLGE